MNISQAEEKQRVAAGTTWWLKCLLEERSRFAEQQTKDVEQAYRLARDKLDAAARNVYRERVREEG